MLRKVLFLILVAGATPSAFATDYYVATTGNNGNSGTCYSSPWASINKAAQVSGPGDRIILEGGVYNLETPQGVGSDHSGDADHHLIITSANGEHATLDGSLIPGTQDTVVLTGQYIDFQNITVRNSNNNGLSVYGTCTTQVAHHITISNCTFNGNHFAGVFTGYAAAWYAVNNVTISNCDFYDNSRVNSSGTSTYWAGAIHPSITDYVTITGCTVHENFGEGIDPDHVKHASISGNILHDNFSVDLYLDNVTDSRVTNNRIYNTGLTAYYYGTNPAKGIVCANEGSPTNANYCSNILIANNLVVGGRYCFGYGSYGAGGGMRNCTVVNNTFLNSYQNNLDIAPDAGHTGNVYQNNTSYGTNTSHAHANGTPSSGWTFDHNCWYGYGTGGTTAPASPLSGTGDVVANPNLIAPTSTTYLPGDYKLAFGSPCIDVGVTISAVTKDAFGTNRPQGSAYDIGFHEYL